MNDNPETSRQDFLRDAKKQITHSFFLALAVLGVFAFACYAWFVSNNAVTGQIHSVHIVGSSFELASAGSAGGFDDEISEDFRVSGEDWNDGTITNSTKENILWRLNDNSHLRNNNNSVNAGIRPGSFGKLEFYVVPQQSGTLTLSFDLELIPVDKNKNPIPFDSNPTIHQLLRGHILFSFQCKEYVSSQSPSLVSCSDPTFTLTFENAEKDRPILVKLNWIWPFLLEHVQNDKMQGVCTKEQVLKQMNQSPEYFFYNDGDSVSAPGDLSDSTQFRVYNDYFNNADQHIGEGVDWLMVRLSAVQV